MTKFAALFFIAFTSISQLAISSETPLKWVESGTVCGIGATNTEALMNLNNKLTKPIIRLEGDYNTITGGADLKMYLKAPYTTHGEVLHEKRSFMAKYNRVACQSVKGKKPILGANEIKRAFKFVCERFDNNPNVAIRFVNNKMTYTNSFKIEKVCEEVPGYSSVAVYSCVVKSNSSIKELYTSFIYLDRDTLEIIVSDYYSPRNTFTESFKAQCQSDKGTNY